MFSEDKMTLGKIFMEKANLKLTENNALAYNSINKPLVELFAQIGALRNRGENEIEDKFAAAFNENRELAVKMVFYGGDIRGGLGERRVFRVCLRWLAKHYPSIVRANLKNIPYYNRWDSLLELVGTPVEKDVWDFIYAVLEADLIACKHRQEVSLLAKWLPSENTSSAKTREMGKLVRKNLGLTSRIYRKVLSALRAYLNIVEVDMSAKQWHRINYSQVPSLAMMKYREAFFRADAGRFSTYIEDVKEGRKKINASTLYPYNLVASYLSDGDNYSYDIKPENGVLEEQWKALPNYINGEYNILVMADMSASMYGRPMETSSGLAIYFAERNKGVFEGLYMSFSSKPSFIHITKHESLRSKIAKVFNSEVGYSTNLETAFFAILSLAVTGGISPKDMPAALVVVSDMEIDNYIRYEGLDFVEKMKRVFASRGYDLPKLILWNVEARNDTFLTQDEQVIYVSGQSPSTFELLLGYLNGKTSEDIMLDVLNAERYNRVII